MSMLMHAEVPARRMSGASQRDGRSDGLRGSAAQAAHPHPLEYQPYYGV